MVRLAQAKRLLARRAARGRLAAASLPLLVCGLLLVNFSPDGGRYESAIASPDDYRIESMDGFCFEPDIFNTADEAREFVFQMQIGDEYSELHRYILEPGERAHLHVFADGYWVGGDEADRLIALADLHSCTLHVFDET